MEKIVRFDWSQKFSIFWLHFSTFCRIQSAMEMEKNPPFFSMGMENPRPIHGAPWRMEKIDPPRTTFLDTKT